MHNLYKALLFIVSYELYNCDKNFYDFKFFVIKMKKIFIISDYIIYVKYYYVLNQWKEKNYKSRDLSCEHNLSYFPQTVDSNLL